ncbi:hypothetical protein OHB13_11845 [Streptomyces sp. NBC_00440]|uniref:hypothetical protein n=1 Tax=Streptomyces sp. NBC_00440 TaxID=2975741 RepID=UPI002E2451BD
MALFNDIIEVRRAPLVEDAYGHHRDWDTYTVVWSGLGAGVPYLRTHKAETPVRETTTNKATIYLPGNLEVDSSDQILFQSKLWTPEGEPWKWKLGSRQYTMIDVRGVTK